MNNYNRCETCKKWHYDYNDCNPIWTVYHDDEPYQVRAVNFEDAAEEYAIMYNEESGEYSLMNDSIDIVIESPEGEKKTVKVSAEPSVHYSTQII